MYSKYGDIISLISLYAWNASLQLAPSFEMGGDQPTEPGPSMPCLQEWGSIALCQAEKHKLVDYHQKALPLLSATDHSDGITDDEVGESTTLVGATDSPWGFWFS